MKYLAGFLLLTAGSALTTAGLATWQHQAFAFSGLWSMSGGPHPIFILVLGIAMIPPALWEIFLLENRRRDE